MATPPPDHPDRHCQDTEDCRIADAKQVLDHATADPTHRFDGTITHQTVPRCLADSSDLLAQKARIHTHLPILAARFARERLQAAATIHGGTVSTTPEVLFVCVHNAGRSQMAAALLHHHAQEHIVVRSAGSAPANSINPAVIDAMLELGIDLTNEFPQPLTDEGVQAADVVITMGCGDACPVYPGKRYLNWELDDPAGKTIEQIRPIRDEIEHRIHNLLADLLPTKH